MGGRGSTSGKNLKAGAGARGGGGSTPEISKAKAGGGGETLTMSKIIKEIPGRNINTDVPKLQRMMDSAKVGTSFEFHPNPYHPDVTDIYKKQSDGTWTFTHSYTYKSKEDSWTTKATPDMLWNSIFAG